MNAAVTVSHIRQAGMLLSWHLNNDPWDGPAGTARPNQLPPDGDWQTWMILAGRGFGKTRAGAEFIRKRVQSGSARRIVIAGPTAADIRDIMIEGESGLLAVCERAGVQVRYNPSKRRVTFGNGAIGTLVSADQPNRFRGLQCDTFWADELASWRYHDAWDQLQLGHRLGVDPRGVVTTTPRPIQLIKQLVTDAQVVVTKGTTYENRANLADKFFAQIQQRYEGTTLGRQELYADILEEVEGALWQRSLFKHVKPNDVPPLKRVVVAVDPATTHGEQSDETGVAVVGVTHDGRIFVLHAKGYRLSPLGWGKRVIDLYQEFEANEIVAESNQGGEMVRQNILTAARDHPDLAIAPRIETIHATRGKRVRAEPAVSLYEQGRVFHVGTFAEAEDQMCLFPIAEDENDDIVDAVVHGIVRVAPAVRKGIGTA